MRPAPNPEVAAIIRRSRRRPFLCAWDSRPPPRPGAPGARAPRPLCLVEEPPAAPPLPLYLVGPMADAERGEQPFWIPKLFDDLLAANDPLDDAEDERCSARAA